MPAKRRVAKVRDHRITLAAAEAYRSGDCLALHRALGLRPWEASALDVDDGPCPWPANSGGAVSWPKAQTLQAKLEMHLEKPCSQSSA